MEKYPAEDVYCIGGDSIYKQMLPYFDTAHVTKIDFSYEADAYFPNLDEDPDWEITAESEGMDPRNRVITGFSSLYITLSTKNRPPYFFRWSVFLLFLHCFSVQSGHSHSAL